MKLHFITESPDNFYIKIDGEKGYMWINKYDLANLLLWKAIKAGIDSFCADCVDECQCLDHPWFNLKRRPKPVKYFHPYR